MVYYVIDGVRGDGVIIKLVMRGFIEDSTTVVCFGRVLTWLDGILVCWWFVGG